MTPTQQDQARSDAESDAKKLALLLLLLFRRRQGTDGHTIVYDTATAKFRVDGRAVSVLTIRKYLATIQDSFSRRLVQITTQLEDGDITFGSWQREFERTVTSGHVLAAALVLGSIKSAVDHRSVQERIDRQLSFADDFARAIQDKKAGSAGRIRSRAKSYMQAVHLTFSNIEQQVRTALGNDTEAKRILRASEHCHNSIHLPGCLELARLSWMPIDEMTPIGEATCGVWCKCFIVYR